MPGDIIARATAMFMGLCAAAFLPAYTVAVFSKNPSKLGAIASLLTGSIAWAAWTVFVHKAESSVLRVSEMLTGSPSVLDFPWTVIDSLFIALPLSIAALIIGTMIERRRSPAPAEA